MSAWVRRHRKELLLTAVAQLVACGFLFALVLLRGRKASTESTLGPCTVPLDSRRELSLVICDSPGIIETWNAGADRALGCSSAEIDGKSRTTLYRYPDIRAEELLLNVKAALASPLLDTDDWGAGGDRVNLRLRVSILPDIQGEHSSAFSESAVTRAERAESTSMASRSSD